MSRLSKVYEISEDDFRAIVKKARSYSDCLRALELNTKGGSSLDILKRRISELRCNTEHFSRKNSPSYCRYTLDTILVENSSYNNIARLKTRLVESGLLTYQCSICKLTQWQDRPIVLQLDHINGINNDHRLSNLRLLCPNCHSQTETYGGKNIRRNQCRDLV